MTDKITKETLIPLLGQQIEVSRGEGINPIRGFIDEAALNQNRERFLISNQAGANKEKFKGIWVYFSEVTSVKLSPDAAE